MKHKNPGAPLHFLRFGTPRSSEAKRPTINTKERGVDLTKNHNNNRSVLGMTDEIKDPQNFCSDSSVGRADDL